MQTQPLMAHIVVGAAQAAREFRVIVPAQHLDFARRPAAWPRFHRDAAVFAHGDDFLDGATGAAGEDRVWHFAELMKLGQPPSSSTAASDSVLFGGSHNISQESVLRIPNEMALLRE